MRKTLAALLAFVIVAAWPASALAWGPAAHRYIMRRAIDLLPPELKPFFVHFRDEVVIRVIDPDLWRVVGWDENANHFLDFGADEYGPYPFAALPRDFGAAVEKFGLATVTRNGLVPWREAEMAGNLRRAFEGFKRNAPFTTSDVVVFSAAAAHYLQDAHQPLHATINFDGQLSGQRGVHARFETALFDRFEARLTVTPAAPAPMRNPRDATFEALLSGYQLVESLLRADKEAVGGKDTYDDEYYERFFEKVRPMLERRLAESVTATASMIVGAWELAGRPMVKTELPRAVEKVNRSR